MGATPSVIRDITNQTISLHDINKKYPEETTRGISLFFSLDVEFENYISKKEEFLKIVKCINNKLNIYSSGDVAFRLNVRKRNFLCGNAECTISIERSRWLMRYLQKLISEIFEKYSIYLDSDTSTLKLMKRWKNKITHYKKEYRFYALLKILSTLRRVHFPLY